MPKAKPYDTVVLRENIGAFRKGEKGAVVEVYSTPYEAYDIEIVTDEGKTKGFLEGIRPEQIELLGTIRPPDDVQPNEPIPPLEPGDRLTRAEFERRYDAMPQLTKAELVEGLVYMPSPVRFRRHGRPHAQLVGWLMSRTRTRRF